MWRFDRKKSRNILTSLVYQMGKAPFSLKLKYQIYSDLSWIFKRMASEVSGALISREKNPQVLATRNFLRRYIDATDRVLDLGCADGHITAFVSTLCQHATGVDYNASHIEVAKRINNRINTQYLCTDALDFMKGNDLKYDVMICSHILEHLDDPIGFLTDFRPYFRNLYIEVPDNDATQVNYIRDSLGLPILYSDADHVWEYTRDSLKKMLLDMQIRLIDSDYSLGVMRLWLEA